MFIFMKQYIEIQKALFTGCLYNMFIYIMFIFMKSPLCYFLSSARRVHMSCNEKMIMYSCVTFGCIYESNQPCQLNVTTQLQFVLNFSKNLGC
jgi:hypothetical protein